MFEGEGEAFQRVDALAKLLQLVGEPLGHHLQAEVQEVPEDFLQSKPFRLPDFGVFGRREAGQVDG